MVKMVRCGHAWVSGLTFREISPMKMSRESKRLSLDSQKIYKKLSQIKLIITNKELLIDSKYEDGEAISILVI